MEATELATNSTQDCVMIPRSAIDQFLSSFYLPLAPAMLFDPDAILEEFAQACRIDYRLNRLTIRERVRHIKWLLEYLDKHPLQATRPELRQFLALNPAQNAVKALRVFYGRFLESDLASCFKVPQSPPHVVIAPTRSALRETYDNLDDPELETAFLLFASSGLRRHELMELTWTQLDMENRIIYPSRHFGTTKFQWATCFNSEASAALEKLSFAKSPCPSTRVFNLNEHVMTRKFGKASPDDFRITPQVLRDWFCCELGRLGVQDRYVDAYCGRIPKSVLGRHYTDYSPERLKEIYDKAGLVVFGERR